MAMSAPPSCVCAPNDHFGLLLHPLFPHVHGDVRTAILELEQDLSAADVRPGSYEQAPGISASASETSAHDAIAGLLLPLLLAAMLLESSRRLWWAEPRPEQRALAPPIPPPRLVLSVA
jgi:hypothetical protein